MSGSFKIRLFDRVKTDDGRMNIRQLGIVRERPNHPLGDAVDVVCFGGRFDTVTEALNERRAKSAATAVSAQNLDIAEAQATHGVPVTEPVVTVAA